jgi:16S rRNA (guanine527-N7)-methyltransferase
MIFMDIIKKYFSNLSDSQLSQFQNLSSIYKEWNEKINVISRKDIDQLYERHVLHSLAIAKAITFADNSKIVDAGTGGGFPGIPLAIYFPNVHFHLVDSIGKKIKVVNEIVKAIGLSNVTAEQKRVEELKEKYDFSVSRAVAPLNEMIRWINPLIRKGEQSAAVLPSSLKNGMLFLKGGDLKEELQAVKNHLRIVSISDFFEEEFFIEKKIIYIPT